MFAPETFASAFARTLDLFRDPAAKEEQKAQFRALLALLQGEAATIATDGGRLSVNGRRLEGAGQEYAWLLQRLELHSVEHIAIPAGPPPAQVFELLRALADQPGQDDVATRLRANGADRITVAIQALLVDPDLMVPHAAPQPTPPPLAPDVPPIVHDAGPAAFAPAAAASQSTADILAELARNPKGPQVGDLLATLGRQLETALRTNRIEQALTIVAGIVSAEQQVGDESRRRQYSIALKRMYTKELLDGVAHLAGAPAHRSAALLVLQRAGGDGVEVLLDLLAAAPTIEERRGVFDALTQMKEGTDQLVHMLGHEQWFVARNVAELVGELGLEEAVPALARQLEHPDERVRKAVALALAKIGSRAAAEPVRRALKDQSPEVRIQAALGVGGKKSGALAMPLVVAMGEEEDEAVEKELMLALGRIGSADAVQALIKFAQPGGKLFGRKPVALRVTAVEALRLAATPAAVGTLEGLTDDGDKQVRAAARAALQDLKRK
ncbi:MAG TPA: HEAT repeat domain-containing protein [Gemmatimonadales bacterium]|nr:HEAT repeat domain-containing protein [Gemmatimonadales bacterium]